MNVRGVRLAPTAEQTILQRHTCAHRAQQLVEICEELVDEDFRVWLEPDVVLLERRSNLLSRDLQESGGILAFR